MEDEFVEASSREIFCGGKVGQIDEVRGVVSHQERGRIRPIQITRTYGDNNGSSQSFRFGTLGRWFGVG